MQVAFKPIIALLATCSGQLSREPKDTFETASQHFDQFPHGQACLPGRFLFLISGLPVTGEGAGMLPIRHSHFRLGLSSEQSKDSGSAPGPSL